MASVLLSNVRCNWVSDVHTRSAPNTNSAERQFKEVMRLDLEANPTVPVVTNDVSLDEFESYRDAARLLKRGVFAAQSGDRDASRKLLAQVVALDPECEDAWMWLASISDYPEELLAFLDRVLTINPENERAAEWHTATMSLMAKTFVKRAISAHHEGDPAFANKCIEEALAHDVNCVDAWLWRASIVADEDEQIECLDRVLEIDPDNSQAADAMHRIEERREEERRLEEELLAEEERLAAEAARLEEERRVEEERLAAEAARLEEERRAEEARVAEEQRVAALFDDAKAAALSGDHAKALVLVHAYLAAHPDEAEAWVFCSHLSQSVEEKLSCLEKALTIEPENPAAKSAHAFLSSMTAPKVEQQADPAELEASSAEEISVPTDIEGSVPGNEQYVDQADAEPVFTSAMDHATNGHDPYATIDHSANDDHASEMGDIAPFELAVEDTVAPDPPFDQIADPSETATCPFCGQHHEPNAFECEHCNVVLSLSDLEAVLANSALDRNAVSHAVVRMEGEWNEREFNVDELTTLALGHLNLGSFDAGRKYLQEALHLDPNNVVLAGQLNALAIRLDEINRQREIDDARPKGKTILVVDDSATVRKLISGKLEKSGHNVVCAADGVEALERMAEQVPDLVLLDINMPRIDGYEVCKRIRANPASSHVPVVMISGKDGFFDKVRGRMAGTTGYVTKPFGPETLMRALENYLLPAAPVPVFEPELEPVV